MSDKVIEELRDKLGLAISVISPTPGSVLIVHPSNEEFIFTEQFSVFMSSELSRVLPQDCYGMVLAQKSFDFDWKTLAVPGDLHPDQHEAYRRGWYDAVEAISNQKPQPNEVAMSPQVVRV